MGKRGVRRPKKKKKPTSLPGKKEKERAHPARGAQGNSLNLLKKPGKRAAAKKKGKKTRGE